MKDLVVVILLVLTFTLGCGLADRFANVGSNTGAANDPAAPSSSGPATSAPSGDPRADIIRASKKFMDLPQFSAKLDGQGTRDMHMKLDYVAPNRFHMYFLESNGQVKTESVMIGGDMYVKFGGRWQKMPGAVANNKVPNLRDYFNDEGLKYLKEVNYVGTDNIDGEESNVYSYHSDKTVTNTMAPFPYDTKIWIGADKGLPKKIEVTYEGGDLKTMTIIYDYSSSINVEPPI